MLAAAATIRRHRRILGGLLWRLWRSIRQQSRRAAQRTPSPAATITTARFTAARSSLWAARRLRDTVESGGAQTVGGFAYDTTILPGGVQTILAGAPADTARSTAWSSSPQRVPTATRSIAAAAVCLFRRRRQRVGHLQWRKRVRLQVARPTPTPSHPRAA